ncbi:hypothetical protein WJX74_001100 [Apatococcus lobatus]|uniref:Uncharacterized protein n=1 Tax=Apatococcus lobatus TaxID=904363 RepID=A0AAW1RKI5_9CHLO
MDSLAIAASWSSIYQSDMCEAAFDQKYILVQLSTAFADENHSPVATQSLMVLEQPSLLQTHVLPSPRLDIAGAQQPASIYLMEFSPNQEHLTVLWHVSDELGKTQAQNFSIYAMSDGARVAEFNTFLLLDSLRPSQSGAPQTWWAPDSSRVLIRILPSPWNDDAFVSSSSPVLLCNLDGSHHLFGLETIPKPVPHAMSWSPDGQYIHLDCWPPGKDPEWDPPEWGSSRGTLFHAGNGGKVFEWSHPDVTCPAVWSAEGCLFLPTPKMLLGLPSKGTRCHIVHRPWNGPNHAVDRHASAPSQFVPAPAGRVLVATWQSLRGGGSSGQQAFQLWHVDCDLHAQTCPMRPVATSTTCWFTKDVARHPGPRTAHIYVIATACGSLHLMDAKLHKCIHTWKALAGQQGGTEPQQPPELSWSTNGTQLLYSVRGNTALLTFGGGAPTSAGSRPGSRRNRSKQAATSTKTKA